MAVMTIFISPKGFDRDHIATIQTNAIQSWKQLGDKVDIVLIGADPGVEEAARALDVRYIAEVARNESGTPLLSDIFRLARETSDSPLLAYVNADIILFPEFVTVAEKLLAVEPHFLLVGQRWDMDIRERLDFSGGWEDRLREEMARSGRRHPAGGSDYFVYPRACFETLPQFAIGRSGWDNWMFYQARRQHWKLINATRAIDIIHQDHDYAHLPGGKSHYRQPESNRNVELAGGRRAIFTLIDCDWELEADGRLVRPKPTKKKILREIETFPLVTLRSRLLGEAAYALFHPRKAWWEFRARQRSKKGNDQCE